MEKKNILEIKNITKTKTKEKKNCKVIYSFSYVKLSVNILMI